MSAYLAAEPFVSGGLAAMVASAVIHPIDLAKVRLQLWEPGRKKPGFLSIIMSIQEKEGIKAVYAGLSASLARQGNTHLILVVFISFLTRSIMNINTHTHT